MQNLATRGSFDAKEEGNFVEKKFSQIVRANIKRIPRLLTFRHLRKKF
jgi:hypothetical protein